MEREAKSLTLQKTTHLMQLTHNQRMLQLPRKKLCLKRQKHPPTQIKIKILTIQFSFTLLCTHLRLYSSLKAVFIYSFTFIMFTIFYNHLSSMRIAYLTLQCMVQLVLVVSKSWLSFQRQNKTQYYLSYFTHYFFVKSCALIK